MSLEAECELSRGEGWREQTHSHRDTWKDTVCEVASVGQSRGSVCSSQCGHCQISSVGKEQRQTGHVEFLPVTNVTNRCPCRLLCTKLARSSSSFLSSRKALPPSLRFGFSPSSRCPLPAHLPLGSNDILRASTPAGLWLTAWLNSQHFKKVPSQGRQILLLH